MDGPIHLTCMFRISVDPLVPAAYIWGSGGRRFKSCHPDKRVCRSKARYLFEISGLRAWEITKKQRAWWQRPRKGRHGLELTQLLVVQE
jgi:hypothetical protein